MDAPEFIAKWRKVQLTERSAAQQHFLDLCALLGHPTPAAADPEGSSFTFERGAAKRGGGDGWADVWKKGFFGWEYKGKHKDLDAAYAQLLQYCEALENPRLFVVCDMDRIVVHTHFNDAPQATREIPLAQLGEPASLADLRAVFYDPEQLRPGVTDKWVTEEAAQHIASIAQRLRDRGLEPHAVARFLDRIVFCLFAEDIGLLPAGLFTRIVEKTRDDPSRFSKLMGQLFGAMARGGDFGLETIHHFNGDLFTEALVLDLAPDEIESIREAAKLDWAAIQPSIFGTLFERGLDPSKRSQLGAHYTSRDDILTLVEPVVMQPLRREWAQLRATLDSLLITGKKNVAQPPSAVEEGDALAESQRRAAVPHSRKLTGPALKKARHEAVVIINRFMDRLSTVKVLDPACGSGNFLYVTLQLLKDLEKQVITCGMDRDLGGFLPLVNPAQLYGIEINPYAYELAQMTVWIGWLQWIRHNGFGWPADPILRPMHNFQCKDAILMCVAQPPSAVSPNVSQPPAAVGSQGEPQDTAGGRCATQPSHVAQPPSAVSSSSLPLAKPPRGQYVRNLPHIQSEGKTYFVTFRTWKGRTLAESVRGLVLRHCLHDHGTRLIMHGAVVMPDHVHLVYTPLQDPKGNFYTLEEIHSGIKGASAHAVNKALGVRGHVWQDESFDHILRSDESRVGKVEYICLNPIRKGLVDDENKYPWLWREWVEGAAADTSSHVAESLSAESSDVAQPPSAVGTRKGPKDTAEGGCATSPMATQQWAEPEWPKVDFIVGNPPFLGGKMLRRELGDEYVDAMFSVYKSRVPAEADLCCYWFEKARKQIEEGKCKRAGLLATQGIRGRANREILKRIKETGDIFFAESDRPWVLDGANVHISMVAFDDGSDKQRLLDGRVVQTINPDLTATTDVTQAKRLGEHANVAFMADTKGGAFDIPEEIALSLLRTPTPSGRPMSDVILPWVNGKDITSRLRGMWIIDFGVGMPEGEAARYEGAFEFVKRHVKPERDRNNRESYRRLWWQHVEARPAMRAALGLYHVAQPPSAVSSSPHVPQPPSAVSPFPHAAQGPSAVQGQEKAREDTAEGGCATLQMRFLGTPRVTKHRLFVWLELPTLADAQLIVFARSDDYFFGVLHSRLHEVWARALGTQLRERESGFRYTPTTCFETFPFPRCGTAAPGCAATGEAREITAEGGCATPRDRVAQRPPAVSSGPASHRTAEGGCATQVEAAIGEAARELNELREKWLNPPEWVREEVLEFPGTVGGPWTRYIEREEGDRCSVIGDRGPEHLTRNTEHLPRVGLVRYPRLVPRDAECAKKLKARTLTNLYNERPTWLDLAHRRLDEAVFAAYGWSPEMSDEEILERLLALNLERAREE